MYNAMDVRFALVVIVVLLLGAGSYAERSSQSGRTFFFVATVVLVVVLIGVSVHALVVDVLSLRRERSDDGFSMRERTSVIVGYLESELKDDDGEGGLSRAVGDVLGTAGVGTAGVVGTAGAGGVGMEMDVL